MNITAVDMPQQALVSTAKIPVSYVKLAYKLLARSSFEISSWTRQENKKVSYRKCSRRLVLNSYDKCYIVTLT